MKLSRKECEAQVRKRYEDAQAWTTCDITTKEEMIRFSVNRVMAGETVAFSNKDGEIHAIFSKPEIL